MFKHTEFNFGISIDAIADCDFGLLNTLDNKDLLNQIQYNAADKMQRYLAEEMGIIQRHWCPSDLNALDLARSALSRLIAKESDIIESSDFIIYCGISNPHPITTLSAKLAYEFGFKGYPSCWDLKSGCSTGVLALIQSLQLFSCGAQSGIIICSETLSKFCNPKTLQMAAVVGDGAVALRVSKSDAWKVKAIRHGSNPQYSHLMNVPGNFPVDPENYQPAHYKFEFSEKNTGLLQLRKHWLESLSGLIEDSGFPATNIQQYVPHQVDYKKNIAIAEACGITTENVASNFSHFGNMGCPSVFLNYLNNCGEIQAGNGLVFHAVGGGISWAGMYLEKQ